MAGEKRENKPKHLEAGRRLYAAILSLQMRVGLEYAYRNCTPDIVNQGWCDLAWKLQRAVASGIMEQVLMKELNSHIM